MLECVWYLLKVVWLFGYVIPICCFCLKGGGSAAFENGVIAGRVML